jgi:hypothetical protein
MRKRGKKQSIDTCCIYLSIQFDVRLSTDIMLSDGIILLWPRLNMLLHDNRSHHLHIKRKKEKKRHGLNRFGKFQLDYILKYDTCEKCWSTVHWWSMIWNHQFNDIIMRNLFQSQLQRNVDCLLIDVKIKTLSKHWY